MARYQLILDNIHKNTAPDDPRRSLIAVALDAMQDLAQKVNQQVAVHQDAQVGVQASLPGVLELNTRLRLSLWWRRFSW